MQTSPARQMLTMSLVLSIRMILAIVTDECGDKLSSAIIFFIFISHSFRLFCLIHFACRSTAREAIKPHTCEK